MTRSSLTQRNVQVVDLKRRLEETHLMLAQSWEEEQLASADSDTDDAESKRDEDGKMRDPAQDELERGEQEGGGGGGGLCLDDDGGVVEGRVGGDRGGWDTWSVLNRSLSTVHTAELSGSSTEAPGRRGLTPEKLTQEDLNRSLSTIYTADALTDASGLSDDLAAVAQDAVGVHAAGFEPITEPRGAPVGVGVIAYGETRGGDNDLAQEAQLPLHSPASPQHDIDSGLTVEAARQTESIRLAKSITPRALGDNGVRDEATRQAETPRLSKGALGLHVMAQRTP